MNRKAYYSLAEEGDELVVDMFGDVSSWGWGDTVSLQNLSEAIKARDGVKQITVRINSYGGEVAEGLAIYNALKNHPAKVTTECYGFACSIASVIFMAGDVRKMNAASLLMIHNAWTCAQGNAGDMRKIAEDLDVITSASVAAYMSRANVPEDEVRELMDAESWLTPAQALEIGFATVIEADEESDKPSQSARKALMALVLKAKQVEEDDEEPEKDDEDTEEPEKDGDEPEKDDEKDPDEDDEAKQAEKDPDKDDEDGEDPEADPEKDGEDPEKDGEDEEDKEKQGALLRFFAAIARQ